MSLMSIGAAMGAMGLGPSAELEAQERERAARDEAMAYIRFKWPEAEWGDIYGEARKHCVTGFCLQAFSLDGGQWGDLHGLPLELKLRWLGKGEKCADTNRRLDAQCRQLSDKVIALEHKTEAAAAQNRKLIVVVGKEILSLVDDLPTGRPVQPAEQMQERGFAAAGFAGDRGKGALLKGEAHVLQRMNGRGGAAIGLGQIFTTDNVHIVSSVNTAKERFCPLAVSYKVNLTFR